jgi:hypothetical protein
MKVKRPSRAADNSPVYNIEVKKEWLCIFTAHLRLWHVKGRFYFYIFLSILLLGPNTIKRIWGRLFLSPVEAWLLYHLNRYNGFANMAIFSIMVTINLNIWLGISYMKKSAVDLLCTFLCEVRQADTHTQTHTHTKTHTHTHKTNFPI